MDIKEGGRPWIMTREEDVDYGRRGGDSPTEHIITLRITSERITSERIKTERITS